MLLKDRFESEELLALRYLNTRMELTGKEKFHYLNLEKGFDGEKQFDLLAESLQEERYIINDLLLEVNTSYFQIDKIIISQGVIHFLDIKNFSGDCYIKSGNLYSVATDREYKNPVDQLKKSATLFRQLLQNLKLHYLVEPLVIYINPEFTLYQAPLDDPTVLPTQVHRFLRDLNNTSSKLNDGHKKLAQKLISLHKTKHPFAVLPTYSYDQLQKGVYCKICKCFLISIKNNKVVCGKCGALEKVEDAILRNVKELVLLFPDYKITSQSVYEWCKLDVNKRTVCRILKKNFTAFGNTRDTYFK
jgi:hypothetical protein